MAGSLLLPIVERSARRSDRPAKGRSGRGRARMGREPAGASELAASLQGKGYRMRNAADLDPLLDQVGDARYVLLGEASHGTAEFYTWRAALSRRLILEKGFSFIAVEGDWPDCYRLNQFVQGRPTSGGSAREVLRPSSAGRPGCGPTRKSLSLRNGCDSTTKDGPRIGGSGFTDSMCTVSATPSAESPTICNSI